MPFRSWKYVFALGLTVSLSGQAWRQAATEDQPRQEEGAADADDDSANQSAQAVDFLPALEGIEAAIRDLIADEDKITAKAQQDRESRDLEAQERMAQWAEWMFYATAATVALTLAALFAIIRTLHHTRRAADYTGDMLEEAKKSTAAANRAVAETVNTSKNQLRSYVCLASTRNLPVRGEEVSTEFRIQNYGASPAKVSVEVKFFISNKGETEKETLAGSAGKENSLLAPNQSIDFPVQISGPDTQALLSEIRKGNVVFTFKLYITSVDIFHDSWQSFYHLRLEVESGGFIVTNIGTREGIYPLQTKG